MANSAEQFEEAFRRWKSSRTGERQLSSFDDAYTDSREFAAIVSMGKAALPHIIAKLEADESAHFLIHALEKITDKRFTPEEIEAAQRRYGKPLGNQGYARMWIDWWKREGKTGDAAD